MYSSLTDAIVYDIFSPPAASRVYAYVALATYESVQGFDNDLIELSGNLNDSQKKEFQRPKSYFTPLIALTAWNKVAKHLVFSEEKIDVYYQLKIKEFRKLNISQSVWEASESYGNQIGDYVIDYSKTDGYAETRTKKYKVRNEPGDWLPTPPDYMDAIEPNWNQLRAFIIDSATQFIPVRPTAFNTQQESLFYKELKEVYTIGNQLNDEQVKLPNFGIVILLSRFIRAIICRAQKRLPWRPLGRNCRNCCRYW